MNFKRSEKESYSTEGKLALGEYEAEIKRNRKLASFLFLLFPTNHSHRFFDLGNFPPTPFIPDPPSIPDSRVYIYIYYCVKKSYLDWRQNFSPGSKQPNSEQCIWKISLSL